MAITRTSALKDAVAALSSGNRLLLVSLGPAPRRDQHGATRGDAFWRAMQDYLGDPDRQPQILTDLEAEAGAAYARR